MAKEFKGKLFRTILGRKIKKLRKINAKTQVELAKELGFSSTGAISQVEAGLKGLKVESIIKAAQILDVHPIVLMTPFDVDQKEGEFLSMLFMFFEKWKKEPVVNRPKTEAVRMILNRMIKGPY